MQRLVPVPNQHPNQLVLPYLSLPQKCSITRTANSTTGKLLVSNDSSNVGNWVFKKLEASIFGNKRLRCAAMIQYLMGGPCFSERDGLAYQTGVQYSKESKAQSVHQALIVFSNQDSSKLLERSLTSFAFHTVLVRQPMITNIVEDATAFQKYQLKNKQGTLRSPNPFDD